jgi:hypothetical protein
MLIFSRGISHFIFTFLPGIHRDLEPENFSDQLPSSRVFFENSCNTQRQVRE